MTLEEIILIITFAAVIFAFVAVLDALRHKKRNGIIKVSFPYENYVDERERALKIQDMNKRLSNKFKGENFLVVEDDKINTVKIERV